MVHYATGSVLLALCDPELLSVNFGVQLVQVIAIVLDNEVSASNSTVELFIIYILN